MQAAFQIRMHYKYSDLLVLVQQFFKGVGFFTTDVKANTVNYSVTKLSDLINIIIPHFENYPLQSAKKLDFELWTQCIEIMANKEHLTESGLNKIVSIKSSLNKGLSDDLMTAFPVNSSAIRPQVMSPKIIDPNWVSGFVNGEGCFYLVTKKSLKGGSVGFRLLVTQHIRDADLLKSLIDYLGCGKYYPRPRTTMYGDYLVTSLDDFKNKIIPF